MRICFLVAALFMVSALPASAYGQDLEPLATYIFSVGVPVTECSFTGDSLVPPATPVQAPAGSIFVYLGQAGMSDTARIRFLEWPDGTTNHQLFNVSTSETERLQTRLNQALPRPAAPAQVASARAVQDASLRGDPTFCLPQATVNEFARRRYATRWDSWELATGVLVLPVKLRLGGEDRPFDFSQDYSIGTTGGVRMRMSQRDVYLSLLGGVALSSVTLDATNTTGGTTPTGAITTPTARAAFTLAGGAMIEVERFQFGVFIGADWISEPNQSDWVYQGQPWLALGMGYSLFSTPPRPAAATGQTTP